MPENDEAVAVVGGAYKENDDFTPDPTDLHGTFNTSGVGAHHDPSTVSPIFEVDRAATAKQIKSALDPDDDSVSGDTVLFPKGQAVTQADPEADRENLLKLADARLEQGPVVIGGPTPPEAEAAEEGDEGTAAAQRQEASTSSSTSAVTGQHGGDSTQASGDDATGSQTKAAPASGSANPESRQKASKQGQKNA